MYQIARTVVAHCPADDRILVRVHCSGNLYTADLQVGQQNGGALGMGIDIVDFGIIFEHVIVLVNHDKPIESTRERVGYVNVATIRVRSVGVEHVIVLPTAEFHGGGRVKDRIRTNVDAIIPVADAGGTASDIGDGVIHSERLIRRDGRRQVHSGDH